MAKFIIVLCAFVATASAGPGLVAPLGGFPLAYAQGLPYSTPLTYSASLAYSSPVAYGLASGGGSRVDIQNNYNLAPQFASVPFAARIVAPYTTAAAAVAPAPLAAAPLAPAPLAPASLSYNFAQLAAPQPAPVALSAPVAAAPVAATPLAAAPVAAARLAKLAAPVPAPAPFSYNFAAPQPAPVALSAPVAAAPVAATPLAAAPVAAAPLAKFAAPVPFAAPQFIPAPLRYSAPLLSNYNYYGSPLSYAFPGQISALPFAAAPSGLPIPASSIPLAADPSTAQTTRMTAVEFESASENDSEEVPAKLVSSETPSESATEEQKFGTPAPVDGPSAAPRDGSQSPVAPVRVNKNN